MANTGRPPKPTALKQLQGNPGHRKSNSKEPKPDATIPDCPAFLRDEAKFEWERIVADLHTCGLLTKVDRAVLAAYCQSWARWREAEVAVKKEGQVIEGARGGKYLNPNLVAASMAQKQMAELAGQLGMTPSARTRIRVEKPKEPEKTFIQKMYESTQKM